MKVGFTEEQETKPASGGEVAVQDAPSAPAIYQGSGDGEMEGHYDMSDVRLPRINLVNKSGKLADDFAGGSFVLNKEILLCDGKTPVDMTVLWCQKRYQENIPFDDQDITPPRVFDTPDEIKKAGGQLGYKKGVGLFSAFANLNVLFPAPKTVTEEQLVEFPYHHEGVDYVLARMTFASSAYSSAAMPVITTKIKNPATPFARFKWTLHSTMEKNARNSWYQPNIKGAGLRPDSFFEFASTLGG